jgi:hypothetical protein
LFREKGGPVKKGQPYIVGEKRPEVFVPSQSGKILPQVPSAPTMPNLAGIASARQSSSFSMTYAPQIDNRGASVEAVARLEQIQARERATFEARVVKTIRDANSKGVRLNG